MADKKVIFGDYRPLIDGFEIAEVSSPALDKARANLATRPPYRDRAVLEGMSNADVLEARKVSLLGSGLVQAVVEVGEASDDLLECVAVSKRGALALKSAEQNTEEAIDSDQSSFDEAFAAIRALDTENYIEILNPYKVQIV